MPEELQVLFVDDEESIRLTLPLMLERFGFRVVSAATVAAALRLMSERKFDVLISDMNIERPGDGFTVVSAMRSTQPKAVRFILTGFPDVESALQALREEVDDYLIKPTEIEEIVAKIRSKLERRGGPPSEVERKPLFEIIKREQEYITKTWLSLAKEVQSSVKINYPTRNARITFLDCWTLLRESSEGDKLPAVTGSLLQSMVRPV